MAEKIAEEIKRFRDSFQLIFLTTELNDKTYYRVRVGSYSL